MTDTNTTSVVVIPIKSFDGAKERLSSALSATQRHALARYTATRVVHAAAPLPVMIVCDDDEVATWACDRGATVVRQHKAGLNNAAHAGLDAAREAGYTWAIIAHSDLPMAKGFAHLIDPAMPITTVRLVSDTQGDGTNVLVIATNSTFEFHYGQGSFRAHWDEAIGRGLAPQVVDDPELAIDIDTTADLVYLPAQWLDATNELF